MLLMGGERMDFTAVEIFFAHLSATGINPSQKDIKLNIGMHNKTTQPQYRRLYN
jgi:hypothetical protein